MQCAESLRVQAYVDGEVDALTGADIERHLEHCTECQALRSRTEELRSAIRTQIRVPNAPPELRDRVMRALNAERTLEVRDTDRARTRKSRWTFWSGAASGFGTAAAAAAVVAFWVLTPLRLNPMVDELLRAHMSSLASSHLIDVVSTDRHTVKPWFAGRTDISPVVADFAPQGYALAGGRVDYLEHQRAAVVVYQHGPHVINVYCWAATSKVLPRNATRHGYHLAFWQSGDLAYAAVSDTGWDELLGLARLLKGLGPGDPPP